MYDHAVTLVTIWLVLHTSSAEGSLPVQSIRFPAAMHNNESEENSTSGPGGGGASSGDVGKVAAPIEVSTFGI